MENKSIYTPRQWTDGGYTFTEAIHQEYANCCFSAGFVSGHPLDNLYIQVEKDGKVTTQLLLRPDEMAAIAWITTGVLWSLAMKENQK